MNHPRLNKNPQFRNFNKKVKSLCFVKRTQLWKGKTIILNNKCCQKIDRFSNIDKGFTITNKMKKDKIKEKNQNNN